MSDDENEDDIPDSVGWMSDTPSGVVDLLLQDERTCFIDGTVISFDLGNNLDDFMELSLCPAPQRHLHVTFDVEAQIFQCSVGSVIAYTLALALDQTEWKSSIPDPTDVSGAWKDVLQVILEINGEFGTFLREEATETGAIGDPTMWVKNLEDRSDPPGPNSNLH
jgi:hypothetical protein